MLCGKATQRHTGPRRRPLARPGRLPDAFTKGNITHLLASETTGALTPEVIRLLHVLDKSTNDAQGHDSTHYGLGRASPQSPVLLPAPPRCRLMRHRPRRCPYDPQPRGPHSKHTPSITLSVIRILWCKFLHSLYMSVKKIYTHRSECKR
jgi:hypothetical protein